jgi:hypothetical protein
MWAIRGRLVPLSSDLTVAPNEAAAFTGRVWVGDDGTIAAVTKGSKAGPPGSAGAQVIDVGSSLVLPGLIDLHNHLAYSTLPLWIEPRQQTPFPHHNSWTRADTYAASTTWPAYALSVITPDPDGNNSGPNYDERFSESDYAPIPRGDLPFGLPSWVGDDFRGRQLRPKRRNSVERDAADLLHTLIWRAPAG